MVKVYQYIEDSYRFQIIGEGKVSQLKEKFLFVSFKDLETSYLGKDFNNELVVIGLGQDQRVFAIAKEELEENPNIEEVFI